MIKDISHSKAQTKAAEWIREYTKNNPDKVIFTAGDMMKAYESGIKNTKHERHNILHK